MITMTEPKIANLIRNRHSVRSFQTMPLGPREKNYLKSLITIAKNPFGVKVRLHMIDRDTDAKGETLGTYGIVKGASTYLGASIKESDMSELAPLALGYTLQSVLLGAEKEGLGSVWLGGTFKRSQFESLMNIEEDEWFPAVAPVGYAQERRSTADNMLRLMAKSDERELWRNIFTEDSFQVQLSEEHAGDYALPLEMLRLAPSSSNGQPWRVVKKDNRFYFYETHKGSLGRDAVRMKELDLGIGICHFHLTALAMGLSGHFEHNRLTDIRIPEDTFYHITYVAE